MNKFDSKYMEAGQVFTPGSPVSARDLFAGRIDQLQRIMDAISQRGYHAVLYGERGVGKTSLSNILINSLQPMGYLVARVNCDAGDTYSSIWRKALKEISYTSARPGMGFGAENKKTVTSIADMLPEVIQPDDVRRILTNLGNDYATLIVLDEYDRLSPNSNACVLISDTIKALSDFGANASLLLIGVAESIDQLVEGHLSIERAMVQIPMPRMSPAEIGQILTNGLGRLGMTMSAGASSHLVDLAQGLPYIAHLLALNSVRTALQTGSLLVSREHVDVGINSSLEQWQQSIKTAYYDAVKSQQPGAIYKEVLLACALAEVDELGYFTAASVRGPLRHITGRDYDIPNFSGHLKQFSEQTRGEIIARVGESRRLRYRFQSPLMRPYIVMRGHVEKLLS